MMRSSRMILGFGWLLAGMVQGAEFPNPFFPHRMVRTQTQVVERPSAAEGVPLTSCGPLIGVILIAGAACASLQLVHLFQTRRSRRIQNRLEYGLTSALEGGRLSFDAVTELRGSERKLCGTEVRISWQQAGKTYDVRGICRDRSMTGLGLLVDAVVPDRAIVQVKDPNAGRVRQGCVQYCIKNGSAYFVGLQLRHCDAFEHAA